ncbi:MAG: shikimate dehydrogenase [Rhodocyclaceae bacterium]|jgi:shikimate dehydrogenase|nr:shikimate dehydrogenase [Rhodocyclaceae bacterium]
MADRYAVFGNPVGHSQSPRIHALFAQQTSQNLSYEALLAPLDGFADHVRTFIARGGCGANVTVPFKEEAFRLATQLTPRAQAAGAVNTLSFTEGQILGDNTDGAGLVRDIRINLCVAVQGARVLLLGAGGAARGTMLPLLGERPAQLTIANRTRAKAETLCSQVGAGNTAICDFTELRAQPAFDVVINATSAGLSDAALPIPDSVFASHTLAYDMLYGRETPFMAQAQRNGARVADGLGMLVEQAAEAFFGWRGVRPDTAPVLAALRAASR